MRIDLRGSLLFRNMHLQGSQESMKITCPHCGKVQRVAPHYMGKRYMCVWCMKMLDVKADKPVSLNLPPQLAQAPKPVVEEEPLLASIVEEPSVASVVAEPSQKKSIWLSLPVLDDLWN